MEQTTEGNTIVAVVKTRVVNARKELREANKVLKKAEELSPQLPPVLLKHRWYSFRSLWEKGKWHLETPYLESSEADAFVAELREAGIVLKPTIKGHANEWKYIGDIVIGGDSIHIVVDGGTKPAACRVETVKETTESIKYIAICNETNEEL